MPYQPFQLHKTKKGKLFMAVVSRNGKMTWRTSEDYERRAGAIKATRSIAKTLGVVWDGLYKDCSHEVSKLNIIMPK